MQPEDKEQSATNCINCNTHIAPGLLICPGCNLLVHADELKTLVEQAKNAENENDTVKAISLWRQAFFLLPDNTRQYEVIGNKVQELSCKIEKENNNITGFYDKSTLSKDLHDSPSEWKKKAIGLGAIGLILWKFKAIIAFILTKGKILLLGLTKAGTLFSMFLSLSLYWSIWGWKFALGIIISIYVHEMGHIAALRQFGIKSSAPTFIPGLGAVVRMKQHPANPIEDARVGLAGPIWGLGIAVCIYIAFLITNWGSLAAIAKIGAWINLFNLLAIHPLDGGRGFSSMDQKQRFIAVGVIGIMWFFTSEGLLLLLLLAALFRALVKSTHKISDNRALIQYIFLVVTLSAMCMIPVPI